MTVFVFVPSRQYRFDSVLSVNVDSVEGRYGLLECHVDAALALDVGILHMVDESGSEHYLGIDGGILVKIGGEVRISSGRAIAGEELGRIEEAVVYRRHEEERKEEAKLRSLARLELQLARSIAGTGATGP